MGKYFGTDGFRGRAGENLLSLHAYKIGSFLAETLKDKTDAKPRIVIGKDTRISSYMLEYAIASAIASHGCDAYMMHVTTTPSISYITKSEGFDFGIMISASHNPYYDNGIKIIDCNGEKIDDYLIKEIERYIDSSDTLPEKKDSEIGRIVDYYEGRNRYMGYLISSCKESFKGMRIGLDLANGGTHMIAKSVFNALGAKIYAINDTPNGININMNAGSTCTRGLSELVKENKLDVGFAFDGDGDRCIAVDENGNEINGDGLMYVLAHSMKNDNELNKNTVVTTVMSNFGLYKAFDTEKISYETVSVGDRFVSERMKDMGYSLGGESSGHIIISKYAKTGDGILTAIKILEIMKRTHSSLQSLCEIVSPVPQITKNIEVKNREEILNSRRVNETYKELLNELSDSGKIILRPSGTEPVIRISVESDDIEKCRLCVDKIEKAILEESVCREK
jgi:phosphoglucosamine mutase